MSAGNSGVIVAVVITDVIAGFAVVAGWANYVNPVLTMVATSFAIIYYLRSYLKPLCKWLNKKRRD